MATHITYCFVSPFSTKETIELISRVFLQIGRIKRVDSERGYIKAKYRASSIRSVNMDFYIQRDANSCKVRAVFKIYSDLMRNIDGWWDNFLTELFRIKPNADFGVSLANKNPYVVGALFLGGDTQQVFTSRTTGGTSIVGFLAGGALFGTAGAIVGGMSGKHNTVSQSHEQFSNNQLARVIYNNGRIWEGVIRKGSAFYNEIMVNM